jgi:hypothetical protein
MPRRASSKTRLPGCRRCRDQHLRCDRKRPSCSTCQTAKHRVICTYEAKPLRFSHSKYSSSKPSNDPDGDNASTHVSDDIHQDAESDTSVVHVDDNNTLEVTIGPLFSPDHIPIQDDTSATVGLLPHIAAYPSLGFSIEHSPAVSRSTHHESTIIQANVSSTSPHDSFGFPTPNRNGTYSLSPNVPRTTKILADELECKVFDFYVTYMGHWVCFGTSKRDFANVSA